MNLFRLTFLILFLSLITFGQSNSWNGLAPLHATRADVERVVGKLTGNKSNSHIKYENDNEAVSFTFINQKCEDGWNVPPDTLLNIEISPILLLGKSFEELKLDKRKFSSTVNDILEGTWINAEDGLLYYFSNVARELRYIEYIPKSSDNNLRCNGFPPFKPVSQHYPFEQFSFGNPAGSKKESFYRLIYGLESLLAQVTHSGKGKSEDRAYVLVYFDNRLPLKQYRARLSAVKNFVFVKRGYSKKDLIFIEGGMREEARVELYLVPLESPPPAPNPTLPSPQFIKKIKN